MLPWILCSLLAMVALAQAVKIWSMQRNMEEICTMFRERLSMDTNTLITVSSGDRHVLRLAREINKELRLLRQQRRKYLYGDLELKEAVTNISHDLRTPITAISGYLELLEREEKSETVERYLAFICNRTQALKQLTEELFGYTLVLSVGQLQLVSVDVRAVLEESILSFHGAMCERQIVPAIRLPEHKVVRQLEPGALSRIFGNVLHNALKYSDGDLCVELGEDGHILFENGASGLDGTQVGKLFHRYFTVETACNATGLGLSIARTLTEQMGGSIGAEYEKGRLRIWMDFPDSTSKQ